MKLFRFLCSKFIFSVLFLYGYNFFFSKVLFVIPINVVSIFITYLLGISGFSFLFLFKCLVL